MPERPPKPADKASSPRFKERKEAGGAKRKMGLSDLPRRPATHQEFDAYLQEVENSSARSVVIVLSSNLENLLRFTVLSRFIHLPKAEIDKLCDRSGPLNSFSQLTDIGFALGIYGRVTRKNLDIVRRIRNAFAHTFIPLDFDTAEVSQEIDKLDFLQTVEATMETNDPALVGETFASLVSKRIIFGDNRSRFVETCRFMSSKLIDQIDFARRPNPPVMP
ncbi:hypothetical protein [Mesorhizobium sp. B2-3-10]|uniref:hypothetical protein n=1 Tax=Mesorhizobium sp. B2-3-10 TaxID=2589954 RepID=UPI00112CE21E|nr:hypothetical protein [Mesorhizobium sp. B2-3-10]TPL97443.1 hypothetical protein FJ943_18955 [Mesorhizobium sp. B2-3-10]